MIAYVFRNVAGPPRVALKGPFPGDALEFLSKHGMPVFYWEDQVEFGKVEGFEQEQAAPGMVGIGMNGLLYTVLSDSTVVPLPLQVVNIDNEYPTQPRRVRVEANA